MLNDFIYKRLHENYVNSFDITLDKNPEHENHVNALRYYLDSKDLKMPKPKWKFDYKDYSTWPYLPGHLLRDKNSVAIKHVTHTNHDFKFSHLL